MFGSTQCNWDCAFIYKAKSGKDVNQKKNDFSSKHICIVKEDRSYSFDDMKQIAVDYYNQRVSNGNRPPASTVAITNVNGFLEMDSWIAKNGKSGMQGIPVQNGAIFTYEPGTGLVSSSSSLEILVTIKIGNDGRKNIDHLEATGEAAKPDHKKHFTAYSDAQANDIPWWLFGS